MPGKVLYSRLVAIAVLCCVGVLVYSNTFHNSFQFDGKRIIFEDSYIRDLSNFKSISLSSLSSRFISNLTFAVNYHFNRFDVVGYHVFNLTVHLGSAILVWWFALLTLSAPAMKGDGISRYSGAVAFFAASIFVTHPIQTQAVTYICQRTTSLAAFFYLAAMCLYAKWRLSQINRLSGAIRISCLCGFLVAAVLGILTKEIIITLPLMALLYELCFFRTKHCFNRKHLMVILILLLGACVIMLVPRIGSLSALKEALSARAAVDIPPGEYILTQFRVLITYLRLLFIPLNQNVDYDYPVAKSLLEIPVLASVFLLTLILFAAFKMYPKHRLVSFSILWFFIALLPEFTVMPLYFFLVRSSREVIFEERLYLPMAGYSLFLVSAMYYLLGHKAFRRMVVIFCIVSGLYAILAYNRNFVWKDDFTLWSDAVRKSPGKARPYNNRGRSYIDRGNYKEAYSDFNKAIRLKPDYADAYYNRGFIHKERRDFDKAISDYTMAIKIYPGYFEAYHDRGNIYKMRGDLNHALSEYNEAIKIAPQYTKAYINRGDIYNKKGNLDRAISDYNRAIQLTPGYAGCYGNRGIAYFKKGKVDQAVSDYNKAIELKPDYGLCHYNRAIAYFTKKEYDKARKDVQKAQVLGYKVNAKLVEALEKTLGKKAD